MRPGILHVPLLTGSLVLLAAVAHAQTPGPTSAPADRVVPQSAASLSVPATQLKSQAAAALERIAGAVDGVVGYCGIDLTNGDRFERAAAQVFPSASTIKLGILYELMKREDEGTLKLDDTIRLDRARAVPGGILYELGTPVLSLRDYANVMVIESDNTATNVLISHLGMDKVTARLSQAGLANTKLRRYMIDLDAAKRGNENVTTPAELASILEMFYKGTGLAPASQAEALAILKKPKDSPIRSAVPQEIPVASKTGALEGVRADTAIVYAKNRPFVFVAMTTFLGDEAAGDKAIEEMARTAYWYFERLGAASDTGRLLYRTP
ncbi:MAG: class A beta-lactamase-related serine hydrolase [Acidobacteria bacterium]|nr:class A beta-lactamase-related serine hydrolase [Acidobacteriota bacterium]